MHSPGGGGWTILSQSEDQSRPHPAQLFVHPMSTQVRSLGLDAVKGGPRSDPQIATRVRNRASRQAADYTGRRINLSRFAQEEARELCGVVCFLAGRQRRRRERPSGLNSPVGPTDDGRSAYRPTGFPGETDENVDYSHTRAHPSSRHSRGLREKLGAHCLCPRQRDQGASRTMSPCSVHAITYEGPRRRAVR